MGSSQFSQNSPNDGKNSLNGMASKPSMNSKKIGLSLLLLIQFTYTLLLASNTTTESEENHFKVFQRILESGEYDRRLRPGVFRTYLFIYYLKCLWKCFVVGSERISLG